MTDSPEVKCLFRVRILGLLVLAVAAWNGLRVGETIFFWKTLVVYGVHPIYFLISGGIWFIIGLLLILGLWLGRAWGWAALLACTVGYTAWYWFDRLFMQKPHANWPFVLIANFFLLLVILLLVLSRKTRLFFQRDAYERKPQTPTIP